MLIRGFNKRATDFVDFDKPPGTAPGGIPDTFVLANLKDGGHTLCLFSPAVGLVALPCASKGDLISSLMKWLNSLHIRCYKKNISIS